MRLKTFDYSPNDKKIFNKLCKKYFQNIELVYNTTLRGNISIKNIRIYDYSVKVHLKFEGEIFARYNHLKEWYTSSILVNKKTSKIKVNRLIRRYTTNDIQTHLLKLGIITDYYSFEIYKVEWV